MRGGAAAGQNRTKTKSLPLVGGALIMDIIYNALSGRSAVLGHKFPKVTYHHPCL